MGYRGFVRMYEGLLYASPPWARARVHAAGVHIYFKNHRTNGFVWRLPIVSSRYRLMYQFSYVKISSTDQNANVVLLDDPGRVRSQITSGLCPKTLVLCTGFVYRVYLKKVPYASSPGRYKSEPGQRVQVNPWNPGVLDRHAGDSISAASRGHGAGVHLHVAGPLQDSPLRQYVADFCA
jgi:hypothetical protein